MSQNYRSSRATLATSSQSRFSPFKDNKEHDDDNDSSSNSNHGGMQLPPIIEPIINSVKGVWSNLMGHSPNNMDTNTTDRTKTTKMQTKKKMQSKMYDEQQIQAIVQAIVDMDDEKMPQNNETQSEVIFTPHMLSKKEPGVDEGTRNNAQTHSSYNGDSNKCTNDRKRTQYPQEKDSTQSYKRQRVDTDSAKPRYVKPIGLIRSNHPQVRAILTAPFKESLAMIYAESASPQPHKSGREKSGNSRKRSYIEIETQSDAESSTAMDEAQNKRLKLMVSSSREETPILSQETVESEPETVSRRGFRSNRIKCVPGNKVSTCCCIVVLRKQKERYLGVYEGRLRRIYSKYNIGNEVKIKGWMDTFGADIDKLHTLYERICVKYELIPCAKYEGYHECDVEEDEEEEPKYSYVKGIPIDTECIQMETAHQHRDNVASLQLTEENVNKHSNTEMNYHDNQSETSSVSTFHTARKQELDQISQKSDTLPASASNLFSIGSTAFADSRLKPKMPQIVISEKEEESFTFDQSILDLSKPFRFDSMFTNADISNDTNMNNVTPNNMNSDDRMQSNQQMQCNFASFNTTHNVQNGNQMNQNGFNLYQQNAHHNMNNNMNNNRRNNSGVIQNDGSFFHQSRKPRRPVFRAKKR